MHRAGLQKQTENSKKERGPTGRDVKAKKTKMRRNIRERQDVRENGRKYRKEN